MLQQAIQNIFVQLTASANQLTQEQYVKPCETLFNASIGQHVRHIIELFQSLLAGYEEGIVNYEHRKRDADIEKNKEFALQLLKDIYENVDKPNKGLTLAACYDEDSSDTMNVITNYHREVIYNLEHAIHHMALIRIGVNEVSDIKLSENFGVAASTIKHQKACVQ
jgi:hypothetical protein